MELKILNIAFEHNTNRWISCFKEPLLPKMLSVEKHIAGQGIKCKVGLAFGRIIICPESEDDQNMLLIHFGG